MPRDHKAIPEGEDLRTIRSLLIFERDDQRVHALINRCDLKAQAGSFLQPQSPVAAKRVLSFYNSIFRKPDLFCDRRREDDILVEMFQYRFPRRGGSTPLPIRWQIQSH